MMERLVSRLNPWWKGDGWEDVDQDLRRYRDMNVRWVPSWIGDISIRPFSLNFIFGPRQIGKTTGVKLWIAGLLKSGFKPESVFYFNCDFLADMKDLMRVLEFYMRFRVEKGVKRSVIVLDEVTSVEYWWKPIKGYIDLGLFENDVIVALGSASFRIRRFAESFPGRRGNGVDIAALPLSFGKFMEVHGLGGEYLEAEAMFTRYTETGGFPRSINRDGRFLEDFVSSVVRDVAKAGRSIRTFLQVMRKIIEKAPSPVGYHTIAGDLGLSHNTVRDYIELMQDMFLLGVAYHMDPSGKVSLRREKKIFLRDPFIATAFASILGVELRRDLLYEWIVQEHMYRRFGEIYYFRNSYEVDCIAGDMKVEVKAGKPHRKYPRSVIVLDEDSLPEFLLKLGV